MFSFPENINLSGFGAHTAQEIDDLSKALSIGADYSTTLPENLAQGAALAVEDLDRTLKLVTFGLEHIRLWKDVIKDRAIQTVAEFNIQAGYGQEVSPFFAMGSTPTETDAVYNRDVVVVKYLGTQGQVQHNLTLIQAAHGPVVAREVKNKTVELLGKNERSMFVANSQINALEYDGVDAQIRNKQSQVKYQSTSFQGYSPYSQSGVVIDQRGAVLDEDAFEEACLLALDNFGMPMDCYLSPGALSYFSRAFYAKERVRPGDSTAAGYMIKEFAGSLNFRFKANIFNRPRRLPLSLAIGSESAPSMTLSVASNANSQFEATDAGLYYYQISAVYSDGETLPSAAVSVSVAAGDGVSASITFSGSPLYFNVFRSGNTSNGASASNIQFIQRVAAPASSPGSALIDLNASLPGLGSAYLLMHDPDVLVWKQLGSMIKYDLAVVDTSYRWLQLLYGTPLVTAPLKNVILANIGETNP